MCWGVHEHICVCMWKPVVAIGNLLQLFSTLLFFDLLIHFETVHSLNPKLMDSVRLLASEFQGPPWACLPRVGGTVQDTTPNTSFLIFS